MGLLVSIFVEAARTIRPVVRPGVTQPRFFWGEHDARASLPYSFDFGPALDDLAAQLGLARGSVTITAAQAFAAGDSTLQVAPATTDGRVATVVISGGTGGAAAQIGLVPSLSDGLVLNPVSIALAVIDQMAGLAPVGVPANDSVLSIGGLIITVAGIPIAL